VSVSICNQHPSNRLEAAGPSCRVVRIAGLRIDALSEAECIRRIMDDLRVGRGGWVITPNLDHLRRVCRDSRLRRIYEEASIIVADGMPLIWASRLQGTPLPQRVAGSTLIWTLSEAAAANGRSIYLLGGAAGAADRAAAVLRSRYPDLRIAGTSCPEMGFEKDPTQMAGLIERLRSADADIVYVALGSPKQEWLIHRVRHCLPHAWWLGVGISFSFVAGQVVRAPLWMQRMGLEWLHRLSQEPRRLMRRYLVDGLPFAAWLLTHAVLSRRAARASRVGTAPGGVLIE